MLIDPYIADIVAAVREHRRAVVTAAPGAGKTTRVPPALAVDGPVIVLQPRRVAARSLARRIAEERGWTLGGEVGWHVRFERRFTSRTQVLLATEGILTARLQEDPLLSDFRTIVLDEFHERTVHADLGIAFAKQAWLARSDLRLVVMSATIDVARVADYLGGAPVISVPGRQHPIEVRYLPRASIADAVTIAAHESAGNVLCFLAGAPEIARASRDVQAVAAGMSMQVVPLHGSLPSAAQDAAIADAPGRRIILATNIAETSLTVAGVRAVVDTGEHKVARYDADRAIDTLRVERIPADSADQRAGRAGRLGPGIVIRLWDRQDRLVAQREPEIRRVDLSGPVLDILGWGGDPRSFDWLDPPPASAIEDAFELLRTLGAVDRGKLTADGRAMQRLPLHPRLSRILIDSGGARVAAIACAMLSERGGRPPGRAPVSTVSDVLVLVECTLPPHVERAARQLEALVKGKGHPLSDEGFRHALLSGYPDRVARVRAAGSTRFLLSSGHGAVLGEESGVRDAEFVIAIDVVAGRSGEVSEARIRMASAIERAWLTPTRITDEHWIDEQTGTVRAAEREYYGAILLTERPAAPDPAERARLLAEAYLARALPDVARQLLERLRFAGLPADPQPLALAAAQGAHSVREVRLEEALDWTTRQDLDRLAPAWLILPSGRRARLEYRDDGSVMAAVKLQELFGLKDTPRIGARREPLLLALLAPNGRPVQMTRDLRSFWSRTYPEVRKELRGRYPRHAWPEDPST
jgi:ATP-dependent helicase HrpB